MYKRKEKNKNKYFMNVSEENIYSGANEWNEEATTTKLRVKGHERVTVCYILFYIYFIIYIWNLDFRT